jgi:hypothetical protein
METGYDSKRVIDLDLQFPEASKNLHYRATLAVDRMKNDC